MRRFVSFRSSSRVFLFVLGLALLAVPIATPVNADQAAEEAALLQRLRETRLNVEVENQTFADVVTLLRVQTGLNLVIDPRVEYDIGEIVVTGLFVKDLPLETVLNMLVDSGGESVVWTLHGSAVLITARELVRPDLDVRLYPVFALVAPRTDFAPPDRGLVPDPRREEDYGEGFYPFGTIDELIELVKSGVSPEFWEETEGADMRSMGEGRLVVRASAKIHAEIDAFFAHLENLSADAVFVEVHAVKTAEERLAPGASPSGEQAGALLTGDGAGPALRIAVREGLQSTAFVGQRRALIAGYEAKFAGSAAELDPNVETIELGMAARIRAIPGPEGERILLKLDVAVAKLVSNQTHGEFDTAQVSLPGRTIVRRDGVSLVKPGVWHWAEGGDGGDGGWGFLVRATPVRAHTAPAAPAGAFRVPEPRNQPDTHPLDQKRIQGLAWREASLDQIASYLRTVTGLNVYITPRVREEVFEEVMINLHLDDASVRTVLDLVTEPYDLAWRLAESVITIYKPDDRRAEMKLRYFDVKDLSVRLVHALAQEIPPDERVPEPQPIFSEEALIELIRESIGSESVWEDPATIEVRNRIIIARNTPEILDTVQRFLSGLRESQHLVVTTVDQISLERDVGDRILGAAGVGTSALVLEAATLDALEKALAAKQAVRTSRERIVSLEGSGTPKATGQEVTYVRDYDVEVSGDRSASAAVRQVGTLHTGTSIHLRNIPGYPGDYVYMELTAEHTELAAMDSAKTPFGSIDLPIVDVWRVATGLRIPTGRTAAVFASRDGAGWRVLLLTPTRLPLEVK